ncbi:MAG TPA: hypothetical protein VGG45_08030 [Terracidiphilus sp.]
MAPDSWTRPAPLIVFLILGAVSMMTGAVWAYMGKAWANYGWVHRDEELARFWRQVFFNYLVGVSFIGFYFYKVF